MPANLNALIRYKTIDRCLRNKHIKWSIERLRQECTEALGEFRGIYKSVSERTLRDDLRIMKSEILGFNAPITCRNGLYSYSNHNYSIFNTTVHEKELLSDILKLLLRHNKILSGSPYEAVLIRLSEVLNQKLPVEIYNKIIQPDDYAKHTQEACFEILPQKVMAEMHEETHMIDYPRNSSVRFHIKDMSPDMITWEEILRLIN